MINLLYIDLFCGAGGTSTGISTARLQGQECAKVVACVNHDPKAIASHAANHPEALHFTEDIRTLKLSPMVSCLQRSREANPGALTVLWASLECTNFSRAKGGQPRDADSRTLAEHLFRYIEALAPDYIQIENVEEFQSWGDVDAEGHPISKDRGKSYLRWVRNVKRYGYDFERRILNAADYGAYTSRKRFFGIFARKGLPIVFPEPTHCKGGSAGLFDNLQKWRPVREVLDFTNEGDSIFSRKKPLSEKTLERIYAGLVKFVAGGRDAFMVKYNSMARNGRYIPPSLDDPCPTVATQGRLALAKVCFLSKQFGGDPYSKNTSVETPAGTVTTIDHHAFVSVHYGNGYNKGIDDPAPTLTSKDKLSLVQAERFIVNYRFNNTGHSIDDPAPTICTVGQIGVACCHFLDNQYGNGRASSVDSVAGSVTTNPKHKLVTVKPWIMDTNYGNIGSSVDESSRVITANCKHHYLMNPQFSSPGSSVDDPCFTLIARMDKRPPYLIATETGDVAIEIYATDSPTTVKIKEFMALYAIVDITMRMLTIDELKLIQGFPKDYILVGTLADQKKFLGNAVEVTIARRLCEALCSAIRHTDLTKYHSKQAA